MPDEEEHNSPPLTELRPTSGLPTEGEFPAKWNVWTYKNSSLQRMVIVELCGEPECGNGSDGYSMGTV